MEVNQPGHEAVTHLHLVPRLRMCEAFLYIFMAWCFVKHRGTFTISNNVARVYGIILRMYLVNCII